MRYIEPWQLDESCQRPYDAKFQGESGIKEHSGASMPSFKLAAE